MSEIAAPSPKIVLVRPQLGENIGKAARAMLNFGLTEMRIVAPRDGWPNESAIPSASGAGSVIENAQLFDTVAEAVSDCSHVYATTVRKRGVDKPILSPAEAAANIHALAAPSAILFGPERSGLDAEDVALAGTIVTVPVNGEFSSLNLAQAVILIAYEWSKSFEMAVPTKMESLPPASQFELEGLITHLETALEPTGYFFPPDREPTTRRNLRTIITKPGWTAADVSALRGVVSALRKKR